MSSFVMLINQIWCWLSDHWEGTLAIVALTLSVYELQSSRRHNRISVTPDIDTFNEYGPLGEKDLPGTSSTKVPWYSMSVEIINKGLGPARIEKFKILVDCQSVEDYEKEANATVATVLGSRGQICTTTLLQPGYLMAAGEARTLFKVMFPLASGDDREKIKKSMNRFDLLVYYKSFYGQHYYYDSRADAKDRKLSGFRAWWKAHRK